MTSRACRLHDGTFVDSASEAWRHECEARHVARMRTAEERHAWLEDIARKRGRDEADRLRATVLDMGKDCTP